MQTRQVWRKAQWLRALLLHPLASHVPYFTPLTPACMQVLARDARKHLVTAMGTAVCRHGMLMLLVNMFTGERHAYATAVAKHLLARSVGVRFLWYDIACRWQKSYDKWLATQPPAVQQLGGGLQALVPPWHVYAHRQVLHVCVCVPQH